ncbi:MAG: Peptidase S46 [Ignavibacteria bacterium]|nr:MAG: Peptidase S46 [Ignavibacteria bacterium]KAF0155647.1 MAG: Peptidase S46 [Ignavibacteria bacterium]
MKIKLTSVFILSFVIVSFAQSIYEPRDLSKVESSLKDMGKMWTFDNVPLDYFEKELGFRPTDDWLKDVQMAALSFGGGCSAAFVSEDGLIMTNHHCARNILPGLSPKGEDYLRDGYYAINMTDELKTSGLFVDQLVMIKDVTNEVINALNKGNSDNEKVKLRNEKIKSLEEMYSKESGLLCRVIQLYNGGKYSLYGYKRYTDIRLVMSPDFQIASTGWDWDNFTYPRYELDFMFFRAYENDKPVKTKQHFTWSKKGAKEGEPIFVVGTPGRTQRLFSVAQLEFFRDKTYKNTLLQQNELYKVYYEMFQNHPEKRTELLNMVMAVGNARKSFAGRYIGLRDEYIMTKKRDFEKILREKVNSKPELKAKYGHVWNAIKTNLDELRKYVDEATAFNFSPRSSSVYLPIAEKIIKYAHQMKLAEEQRDAEYKSDKLAFTLQAIFPDKVNDEFQKKIVRAHANFIRGVLGDEHPLVKKMFGSAKDEAAAVYVLNNSLLNSKEKVEQLLKKSPDEILNSNDPFIYFLLSTQTKLAELRAKTTEINNSITVLNQLLGEAVYKVYGDIIPPDASGTLRIQDGKIEGYEYNGTLAPGKTTYFGLWDKWNSFGQKPYPWGLHPRWQNIPEGLDLATPIAFASTNDIVGGNSGSSVINTNKEVVGLVHDGNLESLAGDFIFLPENNRSVSTDSYGLMEALKHVFKTERLIKELESSKAN